MDQIKAIFRLADTKYEIICLHENALTISELANIFERYGRVIMAESLLDTNGESRGMTKIRFQKEIEAKIAEEEITQFRISQIDVYLTMETSRTSDPKRSRVAFIPTNNRGVLWNHLRRLEPPGKSEHYSSLPDPITTDINRRAYVREVELDK